MWNMKVRRRTEKICVSTRFGSSGRKDECLCKVRYKMLVPLRASPTMNTGLAVFIFDEMLRSSLNVDSRCARVRRQE
jgi:hypothetical protein